MRIELRVIILPITVPKISSVARIVTILICRFLHSDLERVREGLGIKFSLVIQYVSTFVSGILIGFYVNWRLTVMITAVGPVLIGVSTYLAKVRIKCDLLP